MNKENNDNDSILDNIPDSKNNDENISVINSDISKEMEESYLAYGMSVIVSRALPDLRDGLKPVQRRILYMMYKDNCASNKPHKKSATVVGSVMGKLHPHSDTAIYDAMVRITQKFSYLLPLIDGQGNFGSIDGDPAAAMRYTEARLNKISDSLLQDINKDTIDYRPNYDGSSREPIVLAASFPNILVNGCTGIAVGMATNIPPHNLSEIIDACCAYIDHREITIDELMNYIKGPDFPTAGIVLGMKELNNAYHTGKGIIKVRGKAKIETNGNKNSIIITEVPYMVNKARMVSHIGQLVREKVLEGISDIRDESNRMGILIIIDLKRDACPDILLNQIYNYTSLQVSFGINMVVLDHNVPKLLNLRDIITKFIDFRREVIIRRTRYLLVQARRKSAHLAGVYIAISNIDEIIVMIKSATNNEMAKKKLLEKKWKVLDIKDWLCLVDQTEYTDIQLNNYQLTEEQVKIILDMKLHKLTAFEKNKIVEDIKTLLNEIKELKGILDSEDVLNDLIKKELLELKHFSKARQTIIDTTSDYRYDIDALIPKEDMVVMITYNGYIKRMPLSDYKIQNRGGTGKSALSIDNEDYIVELFVAHTHTNVLFFSDKGQVYSIQLHRLPRGTAISKGRPIVNLIGLQSNEKIKNILSLDEDDNDESSMIFVTKKGNIRRSDTKDFANIRVNGKIAIRLTDDALIAVHRCKEDNFILLATAAGKIIKFRLNELRICKSRLSSGVIGIRLKNNDIVIGCAVLIGIESSEEYLNIPLKNRVHAHDKSEKEIDQLILNYNIDRTDFLRYVNAEQFIVTVTSKGYGKRTSVYEYRTARRAGMGVINIANVAKVGKVINILTVSISDSLMLITNTGKVIRCLVKGIRSTARHSSGVILHRLKKGEIIVSAIVIKNANDIDETVDSDIE